MKKIQLAPAGGTASRHGGAEGNGATTAAAPPLLLLTPEERRALLLLRLGAADAVAFPAPALLVDLARRQLVCEPDGPHPWCVTAAGLWALTRPPWPPSRPGKLNLEQFARRSARQHHGAVRVSADEVLARRLNGQAWCSMCKDWHNETLISEGSCNEGRRDWQRNRRAAARQKKGNP